MLAYCRLRQAVRGFRVQRIRRAELRTERYARPAGFHPDARLDGGRGSLRATVFVRAAARERSLEHLPPYCTEERCVPGGYELVFEAEPGRLNPWLFSLGPDARVEAPHWLRREVATALAAAARQYVQE